MKLYATNYYLFQLDRLDVYRLTTIYFYNDTVM